MPDTRFVVSPTLQETLQLLPPASEASKRRTETVLAVMLGAAAALHEARVLLLEHRENLDEQWTYDLEGLQHEFMSEAPFAEKGFGWRGSDDLHAWSLGFFINKAEMNIAAAFDILLNSWISWALGISHEAQENWSDDSIFYQHVSTRLRIIERVAKTQSVDLYGSGIRRAFDAIPSTQRAAAEITRLAGQASGTIEGAWREAASVHEALCLAVVWSRVNAFKHRVVGTMDRRGIAYAVENALAERAFAHVARTWRVLHEVTRVHTQG